MHINFDEIFGWNFSECLNEGGLLEKMLPTCDLQ